MKEGFLIRFLIVALPAGLLFLGGYSLYRSHSPSAGNEIDPNEAVRLDAAALHRRPVSQTDLLHSLTILSENIGERDSSKPEKLESAAVWIESTLGPANMGYTVTRQEYQASGQPVRNLVATLPGKTRREEIIVIGADYDSALGSPGANGNGAGVAALISIAKAFAGERQDRTVRFVAFAGGARSGPERSESGVFVYLNSSRALQEKVVSVILLDSIGFFSNTPGSQKPPTGWSGEFPETGDFLAFLGAEKSRYFVDSARTAFTSGSGIKGVSGIFAETESNPYSVLQETGFDLVIATDTGPLRDPAFGGAGDTVARLDIGRLESVTIGLEKVLATWANP